VSKNTTKVKKAVAAAVESALQADDPKESAEDMKKAKMFKTNTKGEMLMAQFKLPKRPGYPDPLCVTVNDEVRWIKRGHWVKLPWYVVEHMAHNIERKFRQEKDPNGGIQPIVVYDDMTAEPFEYRLIDPAIDPATGEPYTIAEPRTQPVAVPGADRFNPLTQ
jgi:hypothetical protein